MQKLRSKGVVCVNYLDDFYILGDSADECSRNVHLPVELLVALGFIINEEKSVLSPSTKCNDIRAAIGKT